MTRTKHLWLNWTFFNLLLAQYCVGGQFIGLDDLVGGAFGSGGSSVSDNGIVVGIGTIGEQLGTVEGSEAFVWTRTEGISGLGFLNQDEASFAISASDDGKVIVGRSFGEKSTAVSWIQGADAREFDGIANEQSSSANGVSSTGEYVVGFVGSQAFRWSKAGMIGLGDLLGGPFRSNASDVSADGQVVVGNGSSTSGSEAFRWTSSGMLGLGDLPGGIFSSLANAVSSDGTVVVGSGTTEDGTAAFRWTQTSGMVDLSQGAIQFRSAQDVSGDGSTIVGNGIGGGQAGAPFRAVIWDSVHGSRVLQDVLANEFNLSDELDGWFLTTASTISTNGNYIAGSGINPSGDIEAWVALIPEPQSGFVLLSGLVLVAARLRSRRAQM